MSTTFPRLPALALLFAGVSLPAFAAVSPDGEGTPAAPAVSQEHLQLAQREVEVYFDRRGRRLLVDPYTGEVLAIERPDGRFGRVERLDRRRGSDRAREFLDRRQEARQRREEARRQREVEIGRREPPGIEIYPRNDFPTYEAREEEPRLNRGRVVRVPQPEPQPERRPEPEVVEPQTASREPVERAPLAPPSGEAALGAPSEENTGTISITPPPSVTDDPDSEFTTIPQLGTKGASEEVAKIQVVLDRYGASPGVIDGRMGENVNNAISAYKDITGRTLRTYDKEAIDKLLEESGGPAFMNYTISAVDAAGPFVASVPEDYGEKAELERLGYTSVTEALAERFHMDENYLKALNPGVDFSKPGTMIRVVDVGEPQMSEVARIVADKSLEQVRAYDKDGELVAAYPATIGSTDTPSPSGTHTVERIAFDPEYTYNPKVNFKQGDNEEILTIPPGPNNPVGMIWIALSKPTYGIHGTPEPSKIGKTNSHGCVRLTNWDAHDLAQRVKEGVVVEFVE